MLFILSPAKALDYETPISHTIPYTTPLWTEQSAQLIDVLRQYSPQQLAQLMDLSDKLATLNMARYATWSTHSSPDNARQAVLAFDGDVYEGLQARQMPESQLQWLQQHVCILSGLYGVLRPLDLMQPYRLEMGTALPTAQGSNLYQFWGDRIAIYLNQRIQEQSSEPALVNLASQEYFKAVQTRHIDAPVIDCVFEDWKGGKYKIISFYAKKARGMMVKFAADHGITHVRDLRGFDSDGYAFAADVSTATKLVFRRRQE